MPVLPLDELLASKVTAVTAEGIGWDPEHGELWFAGETAEAVLLELDARRRELRGEVEELAARATEAAARSEQAAEQARAAAERFAPVAHLRNVRRADASWLARIADGAERLDETLRVVAAAAGRLEAPLAERAGRLAGDLHGIASRESELRRAVSEADVRALAAERRAGGRPRDAVPGELRGCAWRPKTSRSARSRRARRPRKPPSARGARPARSRTQIRAMPVVPAELVLERLVGCAERLERALAIESSISRLRSAAGRRRRPLAPPSSARPCAGSAPRRSSCDRLQPPPASSSPRSTWSSLGPTPSATRRSVASTPPERSPRRAKTATSSRRSSRATKSAASCSARSTRSRRRSTTPRRSASRSSPSSGPTSRRASTSSRSCAMS